MEKPRLGEALMGNAPGWMAAEATTGKIESVALSPTDGVVSSATVTKSESALFSIDAVVRGVTRGVSIRSDLPLLDAGHRRGGPEALNGGALTALLLGLTVELGVSYDLALGSHLTRLRPDLGRERR